MNIKDFLIDNYIYIIIVIVLIIITIIGFLADKKKSNEKKMIVPGPQTSNMNQPQQVMPTNTQTIDPMTAMNQVQPMNNQMNPQVQPNSINNQTISPVQQSPEHNIQGINQAPFFNRTQEINNPAIEPTNNFNQNTNNQSTIPNDVNNMVNHSMNINNMYAPPSPIPNNSLNNQIITPLPTGPIPNTIPTPVQTSQFMPNNQMTNQGPVTNNQPNQQLVNPTPVNFVYGQNQNNGQM
jgi:hypothetical protein